MATRVPLSEMESGFAKLLADNDQTVRDKAIGTLKRWLKLESSRLAYTEYLKLWKGLFYCMWMADKPKYQHELAERLSGVPKHLSLALPKDPAEEEGDSEEAEDFAALLPPALLYVRAFWETVCREWRGIDRLRLNKYYYLMKQMLLAGFEVVRAAEFEQDLTCLYFSILGEFPLNMANDKVPLGVKIFVVENYAQALMSLDELFDATFSMVLFMPLFESLASSKDKVVLKALEEAFVALLPREIPEEDEEDEEDEAAAEHSWDVGLFSRTLFDIGADPEVRDANRKVLYRLSELFKPYDSGEEKEEEGCGEEGCSHDHHHAMDGEESEESEEDDEELSN